MAFGNEHLCTPERAENSSKNSKRATLYAAMRSAKSGIIIRVSGVRVPPPLPKIPAENLAVRMALSNQTSAARPVSEFGGSTLDKQFVSRAVDTDLVRFVSRDVPNSNQT